MPIVVIGVCFLTYVYFISPELMEVKALTLKKDEYTNVLNQAKEIKAKRDKIIEQYNNISPEDMDRLDKIIPASFSAVNFANDINALASRYGLILKSISASDSSVNPVDVVNSSPSAYKTQIVSFAVSGPYNKFVKFLEDLETSLRLVDVVSLSLSPQSSGPNQKVALDSMDYNLSLNTYSLK